MEGTRLTELIGRLESSSLHKCGHLSPSPGLPFEPQLPPLKSKHSSQSPGLTTELQLPQFSAGMLHRAEACPLSASSIFGKGCSLRFSLLPLSLPTLLQKQTDLSKTLAVSQYFQNKLALFLRSSRGDYIQERQGM